MKNDLFPNPVETPDNQSCIYLSQNNALMGGNQRTVHDQQILVKNSGFSHRASSHGDKECGFWVGNQQLIQRQGMLSPDLCWRWEACRFSACLVMRGLALLR